MERNKLIKVLIAYVSYFLYSIIVSTIIQTFKIPNELFINFVFDLAFLIAIVYAYKNNIKQDWKNLKDKQKGNKFYIIKTILLWVLVIFVFNIVMGIFTDLLLPQANMDANTDAVLGLTKESLIYTIFKSLIFASIAEELLFRESIRDIITNKWVFVVISAVVYTAMNFVFSGFVSETLFLDILTYLLPALIFSFAYVKNDSNIFILIGIKIVYNIIPLLLLLSRG